jgi:hypothetical protein
MEMGGLFARELNFEHHCGMMSADVVFTHEAMFTQSYRNRRAVWYPAQRRRREPILFLPGFPKYPAKTRLVEMLNELGHDVLVPMYSGTFDSAGEFSIQDAVRDTEIWYRFMERGVFRLDEDTANIRISDIILFSSSFGGLIAGLALKKYRFPKIRTAVFLSPLWEMESNREDKSRRSQAKRTERLLAFAYPLSYRFRDKKRFFSEISGVTAVPLMKRPFISADRRHVIVSGTRDTITPASMAKSLAGSHAKSSLRMTKGGHSSKAGLGSVRRAIDAIWKDPSAR